MRFRSAADLPPALRDQVLAAAGPNKYRNRKTIVGEAKFDSKLEARVYLHFCNLHALESIAWFTRQTRFDLPGGVIYRADFLVHWSKPNNGRLVDVIDATGLMTQVKKNKLKQMQACHGITVLLATAKAGGLHFADWNASSQHGR